ncbi:hypothetical protein EYR40_002829 [Pleurotus pulmonarius]|nr:hypothetical protein EYR40_002829 [Pleurotus pulmonarius]
MQCVAGTARKQDGADSALLALLDAFGGGLWALDSGVAAGVDGLVADEVGLLVQRAPEVLRAYLRGCPDEGRVQEVWGKILGKVCQQYEDVLAASAGSFLGDEIDFMRDVAPSRVELDALLEKLAADPPHASLAVIDPLVPPESFFQGTDAHLRAPGHPWRTYVALVSAILKHHLDNPRLISERVHLWTLRHFVALAVYASDALGVPYAEGGVFAGAAGREEVLSKIVRDVEGVMRAVFVGEQTGAWRRQVLEAVQANSVQMLDGLPRFVAEMIMLSTEKETIRESRVLHRVLKYVLDDAVGSEEVDLWVGLARKLEKLGESAPLTSLAIITAISSVGVDSPRLDRYRNELAASVTGVTPANADTDGLVLLRKLVAIAPPPDSDVIFLPQHRAVNLVKACQQWATSDDGDIGEEVECAMTEVFVHAAPILQNVPGAHWEFIFDIVESNVETCSVGDASTLVALAATVRLVSAIEDLASTNRALRGVWQARRTAVFKALRDMAAARLSVEEASLPRSVCLEALLTLLQELPDALIDSKTFAHMTHLLDDGSCEVQKLAYQLLHKAAKKHTEHLVIEAGVDSDGVVKAELPAELLDILGIEISAPDRDGHSARVFTHLLGWMVVFDLFVDASLKVRSAYVEQLRDRGIISAYFIPNIFDLLRLPEGIARAFKLDAWAVDEFYVQYYDEGVPGALSVLAAHLYYRALLTIPSLVYSWVLDCKDRQLSSTIAAYTSSYFSPVIIRAELAHVRESTPELSDDAFKVKVSSNVSEVTASYTVDDQELEIKLKIPADWPLHRIEVRDSKTVGVDDRRWRAWILGIQQTLWSLNGHVIDGLSVFKRNVALHFEGQVECAICYSTLVFQDYQCD